MNIVPEDESHFTAHSHELLLGKEEIERLIRAGLQSWIRRHGAEPGSEVRTAVRAPRPVGRSGLKRLLPGERRSYWAPRTGRAIPSHLVVGKRKKTRWLCFWGYFQNENSFVLSTFYPGKPAPREPQDPKISREELKASVRFWASHAIVVEKSDR